MTDFYALLSAEQERLVGQSGRDESERERAREVHDEDAPREPTPGERAHRDVEHVPQHCAHSPSERGSHRS